MAKPEKLNPKQEFAVTTISEMQGAITPVMIAETIKSCLEATTTTKEGVFPDYRVRLQAAQLAIETTIGRAVQRQEIVHREVKGDEETLEAIARSPAALAALRKRIDEAERRAQVAAELDAGKTQPSG